MMAPISGLSEFVTILAQLEHGERSRFPFYCALLYTVAEGVDRELAQYVDANWEELDAMTGDACLVFVVGDVHEESVAGHRPFNAAEVYRIADHLGVRASALPCAAFFARPDSSREVLRLRLADYTRHAGAAAGSSSLTQAFRGIASATTRCTDRATDGRLECLREELEREHRRVAPSHQPAEDRLQSAAGSVEAVEKVLVGGKTIATTVLGVFGIVI